MSGLTHLDAAGAARMVDVSAKPETTREATAKGRVVMLPATATLIGTGRAAKGDVLAAARLAGIMAAKRTAELIPLCHPLPLASVAGPAGGGRRRPSRSPPPSAPPAAPGSRWKR